MYNKSRSNVSCMLRKNCFPNNRIINLEYKEWSLKRSRVSWQPVWCIPTFKESTIWLFFFVRRLRKNQRLNSAYKRYRFCVLPDSNTKRLYEIRFESSAFVQQEQNQFYSFVFCWTRVKKSVGHFPFLFKSYVKINQKELTVNSSVCIDAFLRNVTSFRIQLKLIWQIILRFQLSIRVSTLQTCRLFTIYLVTEEQTLLDLCKCKSLGIISIIQVEWFSEVFLD